MTPIDSLTGVEIFGDQVAYADGFEVDLLALLERVSDRSSDSPELASEISGWPSLYHLSRARANILEPLGDLSGLRVLECGAGTGILTRALVDEGADIVAVEGALSRARCAATRLQGGGPGSARVVCADLGHLHEVSDLGDFDLVLIIGVLEYFGRYGLDPEAFLARCCTLLRPSGRLALAIENQIGLKYLLGGQEEHLGLPWIGVEGYRDPSGIRTYSRRELATMFGSSGFDHVDFFSVFPDYKLPSAILRDTLVESDGGPDVLMKLVREPVSYRDNPPERLCDERTAMAAFARAGLGAETSSSILCIAHRDETRDGPASDDPQGWLFSSCARRPDLQDARALVWTEDGDDAQLDLLALRGSSEAVRVGWLVREPRPIARVVRGRCLEDVVLDALAQRDRPRALAALARWYAVLVDESTPSTVADSPNPFCPKGESFLLTPTLLDVNLPNFIVDELGVLHFVDAEWSATGGVDRDLVVIRALLSLGDRVIHGGLEHPWPPLASPVDVAVDLGVALGIESAMTKVAPALAAEAALNELVVAGPLFDRSADAIFTRAHSRRHPHELNWLRMRRDVTRLQEWVAIEQEGRAAEQEARMAEQEARMAEQEARVAEQEAHEEHVGTLLKMVDTQDLELEQWRERWSRLERRWPMRLMRWMRTRVIRTP